MTTTTLQPTAVPTRHDLLNVQNLSVSFATAGSIRHVVQDLSFELANGECLAIVGESGSGKSVTARAIAGLAGTNSQVHADQLSLDGRDLLRLGERQWRWVRGKQIGFVLQDALVSLDPLRPVGKEIEESLRLHDWGNRTSRAKHAVELLSSVGVPQPELRARQRPGELSGGLRQRALIASAIALDPRLVIADEPTTALDVTVQAQILGLLESMKQRGAGIILISHDLSVVGRMADRVAVMRGGVIVEQGAAADVLHAPQHEYTQSLLDAIPSEHTKGIPLSPSGRAQFGQDSAGGNRSVQRITAQPPEAQAGAEPVLLAENLTKRYKGPDGVVRTAVDGVSFELAKGQTLGIVGESGSGKSTTAAMALAMLEPDEGRVLLNGESWTEASVRQRRARRREVTAIYQDPLSSFDPRWSVERILADALSGSGYTTAGERSVRVRELAAQVGLQSEHLIRHPLQLSGGQRQRVAIARALAPEPSVIVCDEAVSALDVTVQAQVLDLLTDLQSELGLSYLFISHDLGVIHHMSDNVLVMKDGRAVETGSAEKVFSHPQHPYTQQLLASLPRIVT